MAYTDCDEYLIMKIDTILWEEVGIMWGDPDLSIAHERLVELCNTIAVDRYNVGYADAVRDEAVARNQAYGSGFTAGEAAEREYSSKWSKE